MTVGSGSVSSHGIAETGRLGHRHRCQLERPDPLTARHSVCPSSSKRRQGYRNLCRLITRMKLRAPKGEGALALDELDGHTAGLVALAGREALRGGRHGVGGLLDRLVGIFGRRTSTWSCSATSIRDEEADNQALVALASAFRVPVVATNGVRFATPAERPLFDVLTCIRHKTTLEAAGRKLARNAERYLKPRDQMAALFRDIPDAVAETRRARRSARLHDGRSRLPLPRLPGAAGRDDGVVPAEDHRGGRARAVPAVSRPRAGADRARARSDREARSRRLLPDRLGHRQLLPPARHPRAGARVGGQQRRLLQPGHHGGGSGGDGPAVRALPVGGARRVARHRPRPAERRPARAGHPARLREVRPARRGDDRQRHHLSRPQRGARSGEGAGHRAGAGRSAGEGDAPLRVPRTSARRWPQHLDAVGLEAVAPAHAAVRRAVAAHPGSAAPSRAALGRHGDLPGAARLRWCRSRTPACRGAWWCSGTRTTAPTWASSRSTCSASA